MLITLSYFPADVLAEIFEHLQYDLKSIYSCVKVNRMWCKIATPILWRYPTQHEPRSKKGKFWPCISRTVLACLSGNSIKHTQKLYESNKNIYLPFLQSRSPPPLFNYILFWKILTHSDIKNIKKTIFFWDTSIQADYIEDELYRNFLSNGSRLKHFQLPSNVRLTKYPETQYTLMNLQYLRCDASISANYYNELAVHCCTLRKLCVDIWGKDNDGLANLIRSQNALQHFEIHSQIIQIYPMIADALSTQVESLKYLRIVGNPCFKSDVIGKFKKLKTLSLENFNHNVEILENLNFPELENLDIICDTVTSFKVYKGIIEGAASTTNNDPSNRSNRNNRNDRSNRSNRSDRNDCSIRNSRNNNNAKTANDNDNHNGTAMISKGDNDNDNYGDGLKRIYWPSLFETVDLNPRVYIEFVINCCPNLWFVSICIKDNSLTELEVLLSNLRKLEGIEIQVDDKTDTAKLFEILSTRSPQDLRMLIFTDNYFDWVVSPELLDSFLLEWGKRRKNMKLYFQKDIIEGDSFRVIQKYNRKGVIQEYTLNFNNIFEIEEIRNRFGYNNLFSGL